MFEFVSKRHTHHDIHTISTDNPEPILAVHSPREKMGEQHSWICLRVARHRVWLPSSAWTLPVPRGLQFTKGQCRKWWKLTGKNTDVDGASAVRCYLENHRICRKRREGRLEGDAFIADARAPTIMNAESERNLAEEELRMILISCALEPKPYVRVRLSAKHASVQ